MFESKIINSQNIKEPSYFDKFKNWFTGDTGQEAIAYSIIGSTLSVFALAFAKVIIKKLGIEDLE